jgi:hypothetical protein
MGGNVAFVRECAQASCPMFPYRAGKNPNIRGGSRERMAAIRAPGSTFAAVKMPQDQFSLLGSMEDKAEQ